MSLPEHVSEKAAEQIKKDAQVEGRNAINKVIKTLTERGYDAKDVIPHVRAGVKKAYQELPNK